MIDGDLSESLLSYSRLGENLGEVYWTCVEMYEKGYCIEPLYYSKSPRLLREGLALQSAEIGGFIPTPKFYTMFGRKGLVNEYLQKYMTGVITDRAFICMAAGLQKTT